jgi:glycosyltransferase involved in cell wall biosynthesis
MKVSIVTGSYNAVDIHPKMYKAFLEQEELIHEWIICDDGSTDGSIDLLMEYSKHPKISAYWQSNNGIRLSASLNNGLRRATGDVLFILMGDTYLRPNTMEMVHENYIRGTAGCGLKVNVDENEKFHSFDWRYVREYLGKNVHIDDDDAYSFLTGNIMLVEKKHMEKAGWYNEDYCNGYGKDDWSVFLRLWSINVPLYQYNGIQANHRWHGEGGADCEKNTKLFKEEYENIMRLR